MRNPITRLLQVSSLDDDEIAAWQRLADEAIEPNPFFKPAFVIPAAAHLADARKLAVLVVVDANGDPGRWLAALPVVKRRWGRLLPVTAAWTGRYAFLGTPLLAGESPFQLLTALLDGLPRRLFGRTLLIERMRSDGLVALALRPAVSAAGLQEVFRHEESRALLERREDGDYLDHLRSHHRREINRRRRRLEDHLGAELVATDARDDPRAIGEFLELEATGWKGEAGTAMKQDPADARFFRELCERFRSRGQLHMVRLSADDRAVAVACTIGAGEGGFTFKIAHDAGLDRFSPGIELVHRHIGYFHETAWEWADSCADPENAMINRIWTGRRNLQTVILMEPGFRGRAGKLLVDLVVRIKQRRGSR